jgi:SSS family solute:Na+ symporter
VTAHTAIIIGLSCYTALMLAVSFYWMKRTKTAADYLLGGRSLPYWVLTGTTVGTCIGTGVVIGATGLSYRHGWAGCAYVIGLGLGTVIAGVLFARMREYKFMTLGEELACYFSGNRLVVEFSNISLFISQVCWLTVQIMGGAAVLSVVTGYSPALCTVASGLITASISLPGGLRSVVYTDFAQAAILLGGFAALAWIALERSGGMAGLGASVPESYLSFLGYESFGAGRVFSLILTIVLSIVADSSRRLTMYSADSVSSAKWSMITSGLIVIAFSLTIGLTGMYAFTLNPNLPRPDQALPWLVMNALPAWLAAFVVVSVASAVFSSANGNAAAAGTFFVRHIYPLLTNRYARSPLAAVRIALSGVFVVSTALALNAGSIVGFVIRFLPVTVSGLAIAILLGRFWPRANWQGALAAILVTPMVSLLVQFTPVLPALSDNPIVAASSAGLVAQVVVTFLFPPRQKPFSAVAAEMTAQRAHIEAGR